MGLLVALASLMLHVDRCEVKENLRGRSFLGEIADKNRRGWQSSLQHPIDPQNASRKARQGSARRDPNVKRKPSRRREVSTGRGSDPVLKGARYSASEWQGEAPNIHISSRPSRAIRPSFSISQIQAAITDAR